MFGVKKCPSTEESFSFQLATGKARVVAPELPSPLGRANPTVRKEAVLVGALGAANWMRNRMRENARDKVLFCIHSKPSLHG